MRYEMIAPFDSLGRSCDTEQMLTELIGLSSSSNIYDPSLSQPTHPGPKIRKKRLKLMTNFRLQTGQTRVHIIWNQNHHTRQSHAASQPGQDVAHLPPFLFLFQIPMSHVFVDFSLANTRASRLNIPHYTELTACFIHCICRRKSWERGEWDAIWLGSFALGLGLGLIRLFE